MKSGAGILPYRKSGNKVEIYLGHMGGPYWKKRKRTWTVIKGEAEADESPQETAIREFFEETGIKIPKTALLPLDELKTSTKNIRIFAAEISPPTEIRSNTFTIEWPPHSGTKRTYPEIDKVSWFPLSGAKEYLVKSQLPLLQKLEEKLNA